MYTLKMHVIHNLATGPIKLAVIHICQTDNWDFVVTMKANAERLMGMHDSDLRTMHNAIVAFNPQAGAIKTEFRLHA